MVLKMLSILLQCLLFVPQQRDLLAKDAELLHSVLNFHNLSNEALVQLLLYSNNDLPDDFNRTLFQLTLRFIYETGRSD